MHLEIVVNQNSNSIRIDQIEGKKTTKGESMPCPNPTAVIRILHELFNILDKSGSLIGVDKNYDLDSITITEINEDSVRNVGEW